ncbi:unnamed protein product [Owenia fusiformis]|uniref:Uncharacterized protein n=1 Tax=Owenia fusiformis TaxID=6347 RepID=A0A8S4NRK1_OWEFU|nr:unnamed protein product [Owenia fusiformis]
MNLIYLGMITIVVSTAMKVSAEDDAIANGEANGDGGIPEDNKDDMPEELKILLVKNSTLGESLIKIIEMVNDFSSDIWKQSISPRYSSSIKHQLTKARNITKMARKSSRILKKSLRWIDLALDGVDKVMDVIMAIQSEAVKIENLLVDLQEYDSVLQNYDAYGRLSSRIMYVDILYYFFDYGNRRSFSFEDFRTILGQIDGYTNSWLDLNWPREEREEIFRPLMNKIGLLQELGNNLDFRFKSKVNALAKRLKQKIDNLEKVSRKKLQRARA